MFENKLFVEVYQGPKCRASQMLRNKQPALITTPGGAESSNIPVPFVPPAHFLFPHLHGPAVLTIAPTLLPVHKREQMRGLEVSLRGFVVNRVLLAELVGITNPVF